MSSTLTAGSQAGLAQVVRWVLAPRQTGFESSIRFQMSAWATLPSVPTVSPMIYELPDLWVPAVAALIPLLTAAAVRQDGSNRTRALVAVGATALLAIVSVATGDGATVEQYAATFTTALVTELAAYMALWSPIFEVNDKVLPDVGIGGDSDDTGGMSAG